MDDKTFNNLKLNVTVIPESHQWPPPTYMQWQRLHAVADEARERVAKALASLDEVDADRDLTPEGKAKARTKIGQKAIDDFSKSTVLENARATVQRQQVYWANKIEAAIKPAEDHGTAVMYAQIRDRISSMDEKSRLSFIDKHMDEPAVVSAVLSAPEFLSGLSPVEMDVVRHKLASRVLSAEAAEAKDATEKAMIAAERGWKAATRLIAERGGLPVKSEASERLAMVSERA